MTDEARRAEMDRLIDWLKDPVRSTPVEAYAGIVDSLSVLLLAETQNPDAVGSDGRWKTLMNAATRIQQSVTEVKVIVGDL